MFDRSLFHGLRVAVDTMRFFVGRLAGNALAHALRDVQPRVIYGKNGRDAYLSRYYVIGKPRMPDGSPPFDSHGQTRKGLTDPSAFGLYVHRFHRSDEDHELHNHPWQWAVSFVIAGGYAEERRVGDKVAWRAVPPLSFNIIRGDDFHRVDLLEHDAWTLFLVGPKASSWSFWNRYTQEETHWRAFLGRKQGRDLEST